MDAGLAEKETGWVDRAHDPDAVDAARRVGARFGFVSELPQLIQETNNTVVWLRPHEVIAKVGKWRQSAAGLEREHAVATSLAEGDAPTARPVAGAGPTSDDATGFVVTLWERLDHDRERVITPIEMAASLRILHEALDGFDGELPSFHASLDLAHGVLLDDRAMGPLSAAGRSLLRGAFDRLRGDLSGRTFDERTLHGEAHDGNLLVTPAGLRWIDFESVCVGPLEWDLAFLPEASARAFPETDPDLLSLLRTLNSARVATWCFARWEFPEMRWHAEYHLERVREAAPAP
jgi:Ser/Thr protein kinase RdoA (MazF antagonist)